MQSTHILIYGDSNSWGYLDDGSGLRYDKRWPVMMQNHLAQKTGAHITLIEEALPGRTTAYPDKQEGPEYNGLPYLRPCLLSHAPVDLVLIMLGTNDCKARFEASPDAITDNMVQLAKIVRRTPAGRGKWREAPSPMVGVIAPASLGEKTDDPSWIRYQEWQGGRAKSQSFFDLLSPKIAALQDDQIFCLNANDAITPSDKDPIHWPASEHVKMGQFVADAIAPRLAD